MKKNLVQFKFSGKISNREIYNELEKRGLLDKKCFYKHFYKNCKLEDNGLKNFQTIKKQNLIKVYSECLIERLNQNINAIKYKISIEIKKNLNQKLNFEFGSMVW